MDTKDQEKTEDILTRRLEAVFPSKEEAKQRLEEKKQLRVYLGIDPTGKELHLGHTIPLLFLKQIALLGHRPVLLIGDFTARIGDPTGKDMARVSLSEEHIRENMETYLEQVTKILPKNSFDVEYNSRWLKPMSFEEVVKLASHTTVQQMIARDMFQERLKQERPIYLHEFLYPLMQGYDSVAMEIDGEVGGNDQTFNMLMGRDLEKEFLKKDKLVFATRLLVDSATGKKMSKSEGTLIALTDDPQEIRRKLLATDDGMIRMIFELCTEKDLDWIRGQFEKNDPRTLKEMLADELVRMYHGDDAVDESRKPLEVALENETTLTAFLKNTGIAKSMSEAKELVSSGAVRVNDEVQTDWNYSIHKGDDLQIGKGKFIKAS